MSFCLSLTLMYTYSHICSHTHTHTCTYMPAHTYSHMCMHTCMYSHAHTYTTHIHMLAHTHTCTYMHTHAHTLAHTYSHARTHVHTYTHTLTHMHTHRHTPPHPRLPFHLCRPPTPSLLAPSVSGCRRGGSGGGVAGEQMPGRLAGGASRGRAPEARGLGGQAPGLLKICRAWCPAVPSMRFPQEQSGRVS